MKTSIKNAGFGSLHEKNLSILETRRVAMETTPCPIHFQYALFELKTEAHISGQTILKRTETKTLNMMRSGLRQWYRRDSCVK